MIAQASEVFLNVRGAYATTVLIAVVCGYLGVFTLLRRIVFTGVALAQLAAAGVAASFFAEAKGPDWLSRFAKDYGATTGSLSAALAGVVVLEVRHDKRRISTDALIGGLFALASAASMLLVWRSAHGLAELRNLVAGEVLLSRQGDVLSVWIGLPLVLAFQLWQRRRFLLVSYDPAFARSLGLPERKLNLALVASLAVAVALSLRAGGLLLVFAALVLPGLAALQLGRDVDEASWLAPALGAAGACLGFVGAILFDLPVSPCVAVALFALVALAWASSRVPAAAAAARGGSVVLASLALLLALGAYLAAPAAPSAPAPPSEDPEAAHEHADDVHGHEHDHAPVDEGEHGLEHWVQLLEEGETAETRRDAAHHLEDLGDAGALDALLIALNDEAPQVRLAAGKAVACLAAERAVRERLVALARGDDPELRVLAGLGQVASGEREGIDVLIASLADEDAPLYVRQRGLQVLRDVRQGRRLGLDLDHEGDELAKGIEAWRDWWRRSRAKTHWDAAAGRFVAPR